MSIFSGAATLLFKQPFTQKVGKLEVDIITSRNISEKTAVSNNPVEGSFNTDNSKRQPTEISISGIISKFSLKNSKVSQVTSLLSGSIPNRLKDAHDELYRIKDDEEPITMVMKYKSYPNMLITSLDFPEEANGGETLRFTLTLKEVRIVDSQLTVLSNFKIKTDSAKTKSSFGRQVGGKKPFTPKSKITLTQFIKSLF